MTAGQEHFGLMLRRLRLACSLSLRDLAQLSNISKSKLGYFETNDGRSVAEEDAQALDTALNANGTLAAAARRDRIVQTLQVAGAVPCDERHRYADLATWLMHNSRTKGIDPVQRRTFLGAGLSLIAGGDLALEATRHGLIAVLAEQRAESSVDEWQEIVQEHGYTYMSTAPADLLEVLAVDMLAVQYAVGAETNSAIQRELRRSAAMLAALTAMTLANLGQLAMGRRWWRTARRLADESADLRVRMWIRGREVVRALYEERPIGAILRMVAETEDLAGTAPPDAMPEFISGKAQALALAGQRDAAIAALHQVEATFVSLPTGMTADNYSLFGWPTDRLMFTRSFVYSHLGDFPLAAEAQSAAIAAYPETYRRGPAQIELQRAMCLAKMRDTTAAVQHAQGVIADLPDSERIRPVVDLGRKVLDAVPQEDQQRPEVVGYRAFLGLPPALEG
jgi:transcriptional regulator with XRE-family HTH domain